MNKYRLIKEYPNSPELGFTIFEHHNSELANLHRFPENWEELKPLFYTEDFADGSFFKKTCNNCKWQGKKNICDEYCTEGDDYLYNWHSLENEILGEPVYEGDKCYRINEVYVNDKNKISNLYDTWNGKKYYKTDKYFINKQNAEDYYKSLQKCSINTNPKEYIQTIKKDKIEVKITVSSNKDLLLKDKKLCTETAKKIIESKKLEFEIGKWYNCEEEFYCFQEETSTGEILGYGFNDHHIWLNTTLIDNRDSLYDWKLADMEEVKVLLLNEARKRFPKDTKFNWNNLKQWTSDENFYINHDYTTISTRRIYVYKDNKWAKTVKKPNKWSIGTYIVVVSPTAMNLNVGTISRITSHKDTNYNNCWIYSNNIIEFQTNSDISKAVKWFITKKEAKKFAKTLKPKLMLGDYPVTIEKESIYAKGSRVTFKEWLKWDDLVATNPSYRIRGIAEYTGILKGKDDDYNTVLHPQSKDDNSIGCIHNVSFIQIEAITKAIKNL